MAETERSVHQTAIENSSGPYTSAWLKRQAQRRGAGLYSRRNPAPPADPGIINVQKGLLRSSWQTVVNLSPDNFVVKLFNNSPEAKFMKGTSKMIVRPIVALIMKAERPKVLVRYRNAVQKALKP